MTMSSEIFVACEKTIIPTTFNTKMLKINGNKNFKKFFKKKIFVLKKVVILPSELNENYTSNEKRHTSKELQTGRV